MAVCDWFIGALGDFFGELFRELWRVFRTGIGRGKSHDGDILKLR